MLKAKIFTLAALLVVLMSNVYVGRAQLELAWENTNYHYQSFNKYKKIIISEEGFVDMRTGYFILKYNNLRHLLTPDGTKIISFNANDDSTHLMIYDTDSFEKLDSSSYAQIISGLRFDGILMDNKTAFYHAHIGEHYGLIFWDIYTKQRTDTILYVKTGNWLANATNYEYTSDGRYLSFQFRTMNPQTLENYGDYFIIMDLLKSERFYAKYIGEGFSRAIMNDKNIMLYPEMIYDSLNKVENYYLQYYDLDLRKISKSINFESLGFGLACIKHDDSKILLNTTGYNYRFYDLNSEKLSNFIFSPQNGMLNSMRVIFADDSLIYAKNAAFKIDWTVGVNEEITTEDTILYPNPTNGILSVKIPLELLGGTWNISDLNGKILKKGFIIQPDNLQIDVSRLINGNYYLTLVKDKTIKSFKFVKE